MGLSPRGALPLFEVGGGGSDLALNLEAKFGATKPNKMKTFEIQRLIFWRTYHLYLEQYGQIVGTVWNLKAKFGLHGANFWIIFTHISAGKILGSDKNCGGKIWD